MTSSSLRPRLRFPKSRATRIEKTASPLQNRPRDKSPRGCLHELVAPQAHWRGDSPWPYMSILPNTLLFLVAPYLGRISVRPRESSKAGLFILIVFMTEHCCTLCFVDWRCAMDSCSELLQGRKSRPVASGKIAFQSFHLGS